MKISYQPFYFLYQTYNAKSRTGKPFSLPYRRNKLASPPLASKTVEYITIENVVIRRFAVHHQKHLALQ